MADLPFIKFYPSDWLGSTKLRGVSLAAKGVWIDLLAIMWECTPRGTLTVNGRALTVQEAAARVHGPTKAVAKAIDELLAQGVAERRPDGTIFSARMVKDAQIHEVRAEAGSKGGRQTVDLLKQRPKQTSSKDEAVASVFAQPSEARVQKPETRAAAESTETAAAGELREEDPAVRSFLLGAGIGEPALSELASLGVSVGKVRAIIDAAKREGKGPGVIVQNVRAEAQRAKAKATVDMGAQAARTEWAAFWEAVPLDQRMGLRESYIRMNPHMSQYTGGPIEDLPKFRAWAAQAIRSRVGAGA